MADKQLVLNQSDVADLRLCLNYVRRIRTLSLLIEDDDKTQGDIKKQCNNLQTKIINIVDGA